MHNTSLPTATLAGAPWRGLQSLSHWLDAACLALGSAAERARTAWLQYQDCRATDIVLHGLDARGLRDIGIARCEIPSIAAATGGFGDPTRVHATQQTRRLATLL